VSALQAQSPECKPSILLKDKYIFKSLRPSLKNYRKRAGGTAQGVEHLPEFNPQYWQKEKEEEPPGSQALWCVPAIPPRRLRQEDQEIKASWVIL
jgi:hypothetical protein